MPPTVKRLQRYDHREDYRNPNTVSRLRANVGQVGNLRRVVNPPTQARLPIARRLTTCPTSARALEGELHAELDAAPVAAQDVLAEASVGLLAGRVEARRGVDAGAGAVRSAELSM